jgi:hypothetical protein
MFIFEHFLKSEVIGCSEGKSEENLKFLRQISSMDIRTTTLRTLWTAVEDISSCDLANLSDGALSTKLLQEVSEKTFLSHEEVDSLHGYIGAKLRLMRDMANAHRAVG